MLLLADTVRETEAELALRRRVDRRMRLSAAVAVLGWAVGIVGTIALIGRVGWPELVRMDGICAVLVVGGEWVNWRTGTKAVHRQLPSQVVLQGRLERAREAKRHFAATTYPEVEVRQRYYREDLSEIIAQYQAESLKYRRLHNWFQCVITVGSLLTSTIAALAGALPAHRWTTVGVSLAVGLAAGFTGYFKFRERSFYLQLTADAIEQEANAATLRVGEYAGLGTEGEALARLTDRVEALRGEQRRRQQQLDQPTENHEAAAALP
ncbi:DUF4231 domain-containing protein [Kitasatospora sp. NPDC088134]|uniref:DUF4231 domain-containing protein n=1 Tax=Kitasatospora sp. NPDC088134 TaxID=3364071 RepID=UPI0038007C81